MLAPKRSCLITQMSLLVVPMEQLMRDLLLAFHSNCLNTPEVVFTRARSPTRRASRAARLRSVDQPNSHRRNVC